MRINHGRSAPEDAAAFSRAADAAGTGAEIYIYPGADHAFAQPLFNQGKTYDPVAAEVAWRLSEDFLKRRLPSVARTSGARLQHRRRHQ